MIKAKLAAFVSRILSGILRELKNLEVKHLNPKSLSSVIIAMCGYNFTRVSFINQIGNMNMKSSASNSI